MINDWSLMSKKPSKIPSWKQKKVRREILMSKTNVPIDIQDLHKDSVENAPTYEESLSEMNIPDLCDESTSNITDSIIDSNLSNYEHQNISAKRTKRKMKEPSVSQNFVETSNLPNLLGNHQETSCKKIRKTLKTHKNRNELIVICEEIPPDETVTIELNEGNVTIIPDETMTVVHQEYAQ